MPSQILMTGTASQLAIRSLVTDRGTGLLHLMCPLAKPLPLFC